MKKIVIFAEPGSISDALVPVAVNKIQQSKHISLEYIIDTSGEFSNSYYENSGLIKYYLNEYINPKSAIQKFHKLVTGYPTQNWKPYPHAINNVNQLRPKNGNIDSKELYSMLSDSEPDLFLLLGCSKIFSEQLIGLPTDGVINYHWSLLPEYRGRNATFWPIYEGKDVSGITFHYIDDEVDQGELIKQKKIPIRDGRSVLSYDCLVEGQKLLSEILDNYSDDNLQSSGKIEGGSYYSLDDYKTTDVGFDPKLAYDKNIRRLKSKEALWVEFSNNKKAAITAMSEFGESTDTTPGTIEDIDLRGIKINMSGELHFITQLYYLPAYIVCKLLSIETEMSIQT